MWIVTRLYVKLLQDIGKRLPRLVRHLRIGFVNKGLIGLIRNIGMCVGIKDRVARPLRRIPDVCIVIRGGSLRKGQRIVRRIIDTGFHLCLDRHAVGGGDSREPRLLFLTGCDTDRPCRQGGHRVSGFCIVPFRQGLPAVLFVDSQRIPPQMTQAACLPLHAHDCAAVLPLRADAVEIHARDARIPEVAAERAGADRRGEAHLPGLRVAAEERELVCRIRKRLLQRIRPLRTLVCLCREQNGQQPDQQRQRHSQQQGQSVALALLPRAQQLAEQQQRQDAHHKQDRPGSRRRLQNDQTQNQHRQHTCQQVGQMLPAHDSPAAKQCVERGDQDQDQRRIDAGGVLCQADSLQAGDRIGVVAADGIHERRQALPQLRAEQISARPCQKQDDKQPDPALFQQKYRGKQRCREETRKQQPHRVDRDGKRRDYAEAQPDR